MMEAIRSSATSLLTTARRGVPKTAFFFTEAQTDMFLAPYTMCMTETVKAEVPFSTSLPCN
jgi:hypothetical protein